jgi:hypothetical protein
MQPWTLPKPRIASHIEKDVAKRWLDQRGKTSGELGIFFLYELALQYSKARKALWKWLDDWEQDSYDQLRDNEALRSRRRTEDARSAAEGADRAIP